MKKMKKRKTYTEKFKRLAVARMKKESPQVIADNLKIPNSALYKWRQQLGLEKQKLDKGRRSGNTPLHDAIIFLRKARDAMHDDLKAGKIRRLDRAHLLTLLALQSLAGGD